MPTIVHFEVPADDLSRASSFYSELFDWKIEKCTENCTEEEEYRMISTTDEKGENGVSGGMMKRKMPNHPITNYVGVPSIDEYAVKVEKKGGKIIVPKTAVPQTGYFAVCLDTENNIFGLWECDNSAK